MTAPNWDLQGRQIWDITTVHNQQPWIRITLGQPVRVSRFASRYNGVPDNQEQRLCGVALVPLECATTVPCRLAELKLLSVYRLTFVSNLSICLYHAVDTLFFLY